MSLKNKSIYEKVSGKSLTASKRKKQKEREETGILFLILLFLLALLFWLWGRFKGVILGAFGSSSSTSSVVQKTPIKEALEKIKEPIKKAVLEPVKQITKPVVNTVTPITKKVVETVEKTTFKPIARKIMPTVQVMETVKRVDKPTVDDARERLITERSFSRANVKPLAYDSRGVLQMDIYEKCQTCR